MNALPGGLTPHLIVAPILLPLITAAAMLMLGEKRRRLKGLINVASTLAGLGISIALLCSVHGNDGPAALGLYLPSNWPVPFGIVLVLDRLCALMLVLTGMVGLSSALFALARWDGAGVHFHSLFQIQLMGLYGAFLTGDLFNLFVFFEVMLAASYGLLLHGSGGPRVASGLHYIAINLAASSLFLIGTALLYGVTGTLNMADLAQKIPLVAVADRGLLHAGAAILATAFLTKAAMWPLNFWLVPAYSAAAAPVGALFAIMTKVGVYAMLRLWTLLFSADAGASAHFGGDWLVVGGLATMAFGAIGLLASQKLERLAGFSVIVSSGTLLAAIGFGQAALTGGALFYLLSSTLAMSALFLMVELIKRTRRVEIDAPPDDGDDPLPFTAEPIAPPRVISPDDEGTLIGQAIPAATIFLGLAFIGCTLMLTGMPPLAGFLAKLSMLSALLSPIDANATLAAPRAAAAWVLLGALIVTGFISMLALSRAGIRIFWAPQDRPSPRLRIIECLPIAALLLACAMLTVRAEPALRYARSAADALHRPEQYIRMVLSVRPVPNPPAKGVVE